MSFPPRFNLSRMLFPEARNCLFVSLLALLFKLSPQSLELLSVRITHSLQLKVELVQRGEEGLLFLVGGSQGVGSSAGKLLGFGKVQTDLVQLGCEICFFSFRI